MKVKKENKVRKGRTLKPKNQQTLKKLALAILITIFAAILYSRVAVHTLEAKQRVELQKTYIQLNVSKDKLQQEIKDHNIQSEQQKKDIEQLNKQLQETQKALEAKRATPKVYAAVPTPTTAVGTINCGDNPYKQYIYQHESGCNTAARNSIGCYGIGQSCPATKIAQCGTDFACQDAWFSNYANKYGGWAGAYQFWLRNHWW